MEAFDYCKHLVNEIGPRWIGSEGEKPAGDWIQRKFQKMGYNVRNFWFDCPFRDYESTGRWVNGIHN